MCVQCERLRRPKGAERRLSNNCPFGILGKGVSPRRRLAVEVPDRVNTGHAVCIETDTRLLDKVSRLAGGWYSSFVPQDVTAAAESEVSKVSSLEDPAEDEQDGPSVGGLEQDGLEVEPAVA
ncbi:unnamed protein product [Protopolystoma xenopodis]|uniref:Uncharacterized protein n=1 Tax=Protopolystoma xenopodis TaxID=117903 RepID=A0A3S5AC30_9PLAT|nr:unnamed protein product [Protopolystoma xenopodis]